jgi:hypothetical protein
MRLDTKTYWLTDRQSQYKKKDWKLLRRRQIPIECARLRKKPEKRSKVPETFGVLSLFGFTQCYSYIKIESVIINFVIPPGEYTINWVSNPELTIYLSHYLANTRQYKYMGKIHVSGGNKGWTGYKPGENSVSVTPCRNKFWMTLTYPCLLANHYFMPQWVDQILWQAINIP